MRLLRPKLTLEKKTEIGPEMSNNGLKDYNR